MLETSHEVLQKSHRNPTEIRLKSYGSPAGLPELELELDLEPKAELARESWSFRRSFRRPAASTADATPPAAGRAT